MKTEIEFVTRERALENLAVWQSRGRSPLEALRIRQTEIGLLVTFVRYTDFLILEVPPMGPYKNYQGAMSAVGALLDAL